MFAVRGRVSRIPVNSEVERVELGALNMHLQDLMPPESSTVTAALVEKLPKNNDHHQESQRLVIQTNSQAGRALVKSQRVAKQLKAAGKAVNGAVKQNYCDAGETNGDSTLPIRFTIPEQGPDHKVTLQLEAQDPSPATVRRYLCASPGDLEQKHKPSSVSIILEESEGKNAGLAHEGKDGNIFMIRRHFSMNPYERLKEIQQIGEISSRDQAMGLHSQYHLALDKPPMKTRES